MPEHDPAAAGDPARQPAKTTKPAKSATQALEHYLVVEDLPDIAAAGRVLRATADRVVDWVDASAVRIATPREVELAAPRFIVLED